MADQLAEHAAATRQRADAAPVLLIEPDEEKALEPLTGLVDDPERRVLGLGQLAGGLENSPKHGFHVELGYERTAHVEQRAELALRQPEGTARMLGAFILHPGRSVSRPSGGRSGTPRRRVWRGPRTEPLGPSQCTSSRWRTKFLRCLGVDQAYPDGVKQVIAFWRRRARLKLTHEPPELHHSLVLWMGHRGISGFRKCRPARTALIPSPRTPESRSERARA